jgi:hypothetical protein
MTKFCKDCKHFNGDTSRSRSAPSDCIHARNIDKSSPDLINGETIVRHKCSPKTMRRPGWLTSVILGYCGASGRWFEQNPVTDDSDTTIFRLIQTTD